MKTTISCNGYEIPVEQGFFMKPALYVNLEKRTIHGEYPFTQTEEQMRGFCLSKIAEAEKALERTKGWKFNNPFVFEDGEVEYILGEYYQLHITLNPDLEKKVEMDEQKHSINLNIYSVSDVRRFLDGYFQKLLGNYIASIIPELEKDLGVEVRGFKVEKIEGAYGCCDTEAFMVFDPGLYRKSKEAVKTVVLHEMCHIKEFNHKGRFFDLMSSVIPDWKKKQTELKKAFPEIKIE